MKFFDRFDFFGKGNRENDEIRNKKKVSLNYRRLNLEPLESREMLSISVAEFEAIRVSYPGLELSAAMESYNIIEITSAELSDAKLRAAITEASTTTANDLIVVRTTKETNTITLEGSELAINFSASSRGSTTIVSLGDENLTIDADGKSRVFNVTSSSTAAALAGLSVMGGSGGGIYNYGTMTVVNSTIAENTASYGGGIYNSGTTSLCNTIVAKNSSDVYVFYGTLSGSNNLIGNGARQTSLANGIDGNIVGTTEEPIDPMLGELTETANGTLVCPPLPGSPAINAGNNEYVTGTMDALGNPRIQDGTVDIGAVEGALFELRSGITYVVTSLKDVIDPNDGELTFREALEAANRNIAVGNAQAGSFSEKDTILFAEGLSGIFKLGGQELVNMGSLDIIGPGADSLIFDGEGLSRVFSVFAGIAVGLSGMTVTGGKAGNGGGILNSGELTVTNIVATGNTASYYGGGIYNYRSSTMTVVNSTIAKNTASYGGGINNYGTLVVTNTTIAMNAAFSGGGIYNLGTTSLRNTIAAKNSDDIDNSWGTFTGSNNLTRFTSWGDGSKDNFLYDPSLPLFVDAENSNYRLASGSQAIDKGSNEYAYFAGLDESMSDLSGKSRFSGTSIDIGAYELGSLLVSQSGIYRGRVDILWTEYENAVYANAIWVSGTHCSLLGNVTQTSSLAWDTTAFTDGPGVLKIEYYGEDHRLLRTFNITSTIINSSGVVVHRGNISANETWTKDKVHLVLGKLDVTSGTTLTIADETIVKFWKNSYLNIPAGATVDVGQNAVLTRAEDDGIGGDTNKDGNLSTPKEGNSYFRGTGSIHVDTTVELKYLSETHSGILSGNETWKSGSVHLVTGTITVPSGVTLTIQPGTIIKFASGCSLIVNYGGRLIAEGTSAQPIVFTSIKDDQYGGDTDEDEDESRPQAGDWHQIYANGGTVRMDHARVFYCSSMNNQGGLYLTQTVNALSSGYRL